MNHAWIALLASLFLCPHSNCDKQNKQKEKSPCTQECHGKSSCQKKDAREEEEADDASDEAEEAAREADEAARDVDEATRDADEAARDADEAAREAEQEMRDAEQEAREAAREAEQGARDAEREAYEAAREAEELSREAAEERDAAEMNGDQDVAPDASDEHGDDGPDAYVHVLDLAHLEKLGHLDEATSAKIKADVEKALEKSKSCMKKGMCQCKDAQKKLAEALKVAHLSSPETQNAMRLSQESLAKALAGQNQAYEANLVPLMARLETLKGMKGLAKVNANGSDDQHALEERVAALEARLGVVRDGQHGSLEERVAELERRTSPMRVHVTPRATARAPRAQGQGPTFVAPRAPREPRTFSVQPQPPTPAPTVVVPATPTPPEADTPELWMRSSKPRSPAPATTPTPPSAPSPRTHAFSEDQRREIQERMQKMRQEMEKLREEMGKLRQELGESGGTR